MPEVFLSHATADQSATVEVANALSAVGIATWASYSDIPAGSHWDERIESALKAAAAVIVIVSRAAIGSRYVRAEVEAALGLEKTVIPVILETADLPLRWQTLQHVRWDPDHAIDCAAEIAAALPALPGVRLRLALDDPSSFLEVRRLILQHPEWLVGSSSDSDPVETDVAMTPDSNIDCVTGDIGTVGCRAVLYYLASPYVSPLAPSGVLDAGIQELIAQVAKHVDLLSHVMPETHPLAPLNFLTEQVTPLMSRARLFRYDWIDVRVIAGRRVHFDPDVLEAKVAFEAQVTSDLRRNYFGVGEFRPRGARFELMSYDRVIDSMQRSVKGR